MRPHTVVKRIPAYLFLPKNAKPPYQVVVVFPGANALYRRDDANDSDFSMYQFTREAAAPCCIPFTRARSSVATV